jgi:hypothetical protein
MDSGKPMNDTSADSNLARSFHAGDESQGHAQVARGGKTLVKPSLPRTLAQAHAANFTGIPKRNKQEIRAGMPDAALASSVAHAGRETWRLGKGALDSSDESLGNALAQRGAAHSVVDESRSLNLQQSISQQPLTKQGQGIFGGRNKQRAIAAGSNKENLGQALANADDSLYVRNANGSIDL